MPTLQPFHGSTGAVITQVTQGGTAQQQENLANPFCDKHTSLINLKEREGGSLENADWYDTVQLHYFLP